MGEHLDRLAADQEHLPVSVRGHDDEITALRLGGVDDGLVRLIVRSVHRLAWHASDLSLDFRDRQCHARAEKQLL